MPRARLVGTVLAVALIMGLGLGLLTSLARKQATAGPPGGTPTNSASPRDPSSPVDPPGRPTSDRRTPERSPAPIEPTSPGDPTTTAAPDPDPGDPPPGSGETPRPPTSFIEVLWSDEDRDIDVYTEVPKGWKQVTYRDDPLQRDWVDPTRNVRLKVRVLPSTASTDAEAQAAAHIDEQSAVLKGFRVTHRGWTEVTTAQPETAQPIPAYELTYSYTDSRTAKPRYVAARFIGKQGDVMIAVMMWKGQFEAARPALERATEKLASPY